MNSDNLLNKFFVGQMILLNTIILILITVEIFRFTELNQMLKEVNSKQEDLKTVKETINIEEIDKKYNKFITEVSKENSLSNLLNFIDKKTTENNLQIINTKVLEASESALNYQLELTGDIKNISKFFKNIEEDKNIKEITSSEIIFSNNIPYMRITIKVTKI